MHESSEDIAKIPKGVSEGVPTSEEN